MATSKGQSLPSGIIKLTKFLEHLNKSPKLTFANNVKTLRVTLAYQNDHWGARNFVKEDLPRIRYANPDLDIDVIKWRKEKNDRWRPELELKFADGKVQLLDLDTKPSSTILKEVMSIAGSDPWKAHAQKSGDGIENENEPPLPVDPKHPPQRADGGRLPNLWEFLKANPHKQKKADQLRDERLAKKAQKKLGNTGKRGNAETEKSGLQVDPSISSSTSQQQSTTTATKT